MRFIWNRPQRTTHADVGQRNFVNFLTMFAVAIAVGVVFSTAAAALALMLARASTANVNTNAIEASSDNDWDSRDGLKILKTDIISPVKRAEFAVAIDGGDAQFNESNSLQPAPGNLLVADGCVVVPLVATERDFRVTIKGNIAEVQVMQTFVIESNDREATENATFHAVLPKGALYSSFRVQTSQHDLIGQYSIDTIRDDDDTTGQLKLQGMIRVFESRQDQSLSTLSSDPLMDLRDGETVVVTYRYQMPIVSRGAKKALP